MSDSPVRVHPDVASALAAGAPVVALETAVTTCGLPRTPQPRAWELAARALDAPDAWPRGPHASASAAAASFASAASTTPLNRLVVAAMADAIRAEGALPATVAVIDGELRIGLDPDELDALARDASAGKVSTATLAASLTSGSSAGTTVSATLVACRLAGIGTFATGGIGGVHRNWTTRPDVSADLLELANTATTVVCAGAKSILDVPATIETLETLGVPVIGVGTAVFPRFHAVGLPDDRLGTRRDDPADVASLARRHRELLGRPAGVLVVRPVPSLAAMDDAALATATAASDAAADAADVRGPARTPFVLDDLARRTDGASLAANVALLVANARLAGAIAAAATRQPPTDDPLSSA